jgi:hypothetical protein
MSITTVSWDRRNDAPWCCGYHTHLISYTPRLFGANTRAQIIWKCSICGLLHVRYAQDEK